MLKSNNQEGSLILSSKLPRLNEDEEESSSDSMTSTLYRRNEEVDDSISKNSGQKVTISEIVENFDEDHTNGIILRTLKTGPYDSKKTKFDLSPKMGDTVKIHYDVYLMKDEDHVGSSVKKHIQDRPFDSSRKWNSPICFVVGKNEVIEGLDIAVRSIQLGQIVEVTIPPCHAFGEKKGRYLPPQVPPNSSLVFHVELIDFTNEDQTNRKWNI